MQICGDATSFPGNESRHRANEEVGEGGGMYREP
jgi:hypothetical protein